MKRLFLLTAAMMLGIMLSAQTQQGYVKTKGRLANDGSVIAGTRIPNATIQVKDRTPFLSQDDGTFSFPIPANKFYLQNVQKQGYALTDPEVLSKQYTYTPNDLIIVMEDLAQKEADRRAIERKISSKLYAQLQRRGEELESLKEQNKITEEKYRELLQKLNQDQDDNEKIIQEMAERYTKMDFDLIDEFNRKVSEYILNGELMKADSLVNSKGDLNQRAKEYQKHKAINEMEKEELKRRQASLELSETATQKELDDLANDCYRKFEILMMQHLNDSAVYYLELRTSLNPANTAWIDEVGDFVRDYIADYEKALNCFNKSLSIKLSDSLASPSDVAESYDKVGSVYFEQEDYEKALDFHNKALNIWLQNPDADQLNIALGYNNIGTVYAYQGDYEKAKEYLNKALSIRLSFLGENDPDVALVYHNLGAVYDNLCEYDTALDCFKKALSIRESIFGENHPDVAASCNYIGIVYKDQFDYVKAKEYYNRALEIWKSVLGENHPYVALSYNNIGSLYSYQEDYEKALEFYNKSLNIRLYIFGESHPIVAYCYNNIGSMYDDLGDYDKALEYYNKAQSIRLSAFGENNPLVATGYNNIGFVYSEMGCYEKALENLNKSLSITKSILGENHLDVARVYVNIGSVYHDQEDYNAALEYNNKALNIRLSVLGEVNPYVAQSYNNIGFIYFEQGDYEKALELYQKALKIYSESFDANHPSTLKVKEKISEIQAKLKEQENEQKTEE